MYSVSKDTLCITFYVKVRPYNFEKPISGYANNKLKIIALTCPKENAVICKDCKHLITNQLLREQIECAASYHSNLQ